MKFDNTDAKLYSNRSACWLNLGIGDEALSDAQICSKMQPDWAKGYYRQGMAFSLLQVTIMYHPCSYKVDRIHCNSCQKKKNFKIQFLMLYWLYCLQFSPDNACIVTGLCQCFLCASQGLKVGSTKCHSRQSIAVICFPSCVNLVFNYTLGCAIRASFAISMEFAAAMRIRYIWLKMCWKREGERSIEPLYFILIVLNFNLSVGMSWKLRVRGWKNLV